MDPRVFLSVTLLLRRGLAATVAMLRCCAGEPLPPNALVLMLARPVCEVKINL